MRSRFALGFVVLTTLVLPGPSAFGSTVVTGNVDTNAPLILDPTASPNDPETIDVDFGPVVTLSFVARMPVTKAISQVTIGDLGSAASCIDPVSARLQVHEHEHDDLADSQLLTYSNENQDLPSTPGKVTWTIPPTTLKKGKGYTFRISRQGDSCRNGRLTTWGHNETGVDGGSERCTGGPPASPGGNPVMRRMWHEAGQNDRDPNCVSFTQDWAFHSSMPEGWLVTDSAGWYALSGTNPTEPPAEWLCTEPAAKAGAKVVFWREYPYVENTKEWVCVWPQYGPPDEPTPHGWYYGLPWRNDHSGTPRDVYLRLDTVDYDGLLEQHVPILKYDSGEAFHVISPGAMTDFYVPGGIHDWSNTLKDDAGEFAIANPSFGDASGLELDLLTLGYLGATYPTGEIPPSRRSGTTATPNDFVSARGDAADGTYDDDARSFELTLGYPDKIYGRVAHGGDGKLWLQYWFFYYFNPDPAGLGIDHEGDWEMAQVGLGTNLAPTDAVYAQHNEGESCPWSDVERDGDRPVVYVGESSHASFFDADIPGFDHADGLGGTLYLPQLEQIRDGYPAWVAWPGHWGDGGSPPGPAFQSGSKWSDPSDWASGVPDQC